MYHIILHLNDQHWKQYLKVVCKLWPKHNYIGTLKKLGSFFILFFNSLSKDVGRKDTDPHVLQKLKLPQTLPHCCLCIVTQYVFHYNTIQVWNKQKHDIYRKKVSIALSLLYKPIQMIETTILVLHKVIILWVCKNWNPL